MHGDGAGCGANGSAALDGGLGGTVWRFMIEAESIIDRDERKKLALCFADRRWVLAAGAPGRFSSLLSAWEVDAISRFVPHNSGPTAFRLHFHGVRVLNSAYRAADGRVAYTVVSELLESGAALSIGRMENYSNAVLRFSRILEAELDCPIQVNLYHTPAGGQGLGRHRDEHDVLVLQLHGEKVWQLVDPDGIGSAGSSPAADESTEHDKNVILRAGDWLYLPRGIWHVVRNRGVEPSAHFTIGLHREQPRSAFRAFAVPIAASEIPERAGLEATDADTAFSWRAAAVSATTAGDGFALNLGYRRRPLVLYPELEPIVERMQRAARFRPRDLGAEDMESAALLARFLAGVGVLALPAEPG